MNAELSPAEVVIKEHPRITLWLEGSEVKAGGNLVLTNRRLVFLKQVELTPVKAAELQKLSRENNTSELIKYALSLNKNNFQLPLSSIVSVKTGGFFTFPRFNLCLRLTYRSPGKKPKRLTFLFQTAFIRVLFRSEPLTMEWVRAVKKAAKASRKLAAGQ
ncbi:MAG: hypothetical protein V1780_04180 [Chloroflexota bacterium]